MAQSQGWWKRYLKAFCKGFFVAVPVAVTFLDRVACVARVEGASMQPSLNPGGSQTSDVVLLNHWKVRNFEVQRGDIVSLVVVIMAYMKASWKRRCLSWALKGRSPKNPEQKIIKRVIALEGDIVKFPWVFCVPLLHISCGLQSAGRNWNLFFLQSACQFRVKRNDRVYLLKLLAWRGHHHQQEDGWRRGTSKWAMLLTTWCYSRNISITLFLNLSSLIQIILNTSTKWQLILC
ncbi:mitochondrial inner membrane protease subunit 2 isoform X1 [Manis pentadactyla]|uniref:mitochondrial inner membrane protease subunit 2 isoform X1 n=1 Tax=Manis pentadactyla TaxID=143292 RepID=UPI00255CD1C2|nr:mitochondrial inner membrane protease subunit 2 isoform X1 [Manis pentadactyla]XP_057360650.1 mitochondrial inner membrane protease subunit 2 isoform X1 [Manis pentadactyla]XP_057360651.1 mitochondrial inner membrane protease subunit 2 isoform X1 [Manis pentadactyla]XP_057360652.1 mitochondrial inner membrane protease subunit 2 isoform X1 [Manis pentadactyla]